MGRFPEDRLPAVSNLADLPTNTLLCANSIPAKGGANGLVPQAHAENRPPAGKIPDQFNAPTGLLRRARPRRDHNVAGVHVFNLRHRDLIVPPHFNLLSQLAEVLHQVVSEGIVVVENKDHGKPPSKTLTQRNGGHRGSWKPNSPASSVPVC